MTNTLKPMNYGHGMSIMILVGEKMNLSPTHTEDAKQDLEGGSAHPMTAAAMEREAVRLNDLLRHDASLIAQANAHAQDLKVQYGFANATS
ncbi:MULTISPECIES: hypothetical protein [Ralstonia]|jgi:hypothetical protein|uniref:Uncharacterized protein n=2 Tax=Ralstonia pickettii TaxID=329 RepID=R0E970_RALPI|nr:MULTISPECIES: hypothetical protein [Ralstonia]ENZ77962.1 hypothetical protein OR214_02238 [Ralstonia pickettii OR214]MCM3581944.1 hypothetical protein [Ralstonia pickettii]